MKSVLTVGIWARVVLALVAGLSLFGCGGGGGGGPAVIVTVMPATSSLPVAGSETLFAAVQNTSNTAVTWTVQEGVTGGSITAAGVYTAPTAIGTYHVIVTSRADRSKSVTVPVVVHSLVTVSPAPVTVLAGNAQPFSATVQGSSDTAVTWRVAAGASGGTISNTGVYAAPITPGVYHITATSQVDSTVSAPAVVTVQGGTVNGTIN